MDVDMWMVVRRMRRVEGGWCIGGEWGVRRW